jgi:hypothetical protein
MGMSSREWKSLIKRVSIQTAFRTWTVTTVTTVTWPATVATKDDGDGDDNEISTSKSSVIQLEKRQSL